MMPSAASAIASKWSSAACVSIFAITGTWPPSAAMCARAVCTSSTVRTKDSPT
jgi:hypothetical protein